MSLVRSYNPVWYFVNLQGVQMDDTYYFFPLQNTFPYLPATVYHDSECLVPWNTPIQLLPNGTLPTDIFYDPNQVYRLEWRHGNTQSDLLVYEVDNYVPNGGNDPSPDALVNSDNQISNPQFALVNFQEGYSYLIDVAGTYEIAPSWYITLTGTGTTTITRTAVSGTDDVENNPPYVLNIANTGWSSAKLYQRFNQTAAIWANEGVSVTLMGKSNSVSPLPISVSYVPSSGDPTEIANGLFAAGTYTIVAGGVEIPPSTSAQSGSAAHVDLVITLPPIGSISITNIQLLAGANVLNPEDPIDVPFAQDTIERQVDHLFHYYKDGLVQKPIKSYLVGWDFPLNPAQIYGATIAPSAGANKSFYAWDQTIVFQSTSSGIYINTGLFANSDYFVVTAAAASKFALIQYLPTEQARKILNNKMSVNVSAKTNSGQTLKGTVSLWYTKASTLPVVEPGGSPVGDSIVASLDADGYPATFNGTWFPVPNRNSEYQTFTVKENATTEFNDYPINGWNMQGHADCNLATFFAIVVGFAELPINQSIQFNSISLVPGNIPTRPAPQTPDEVHRECEYYFEASYNAGVAGGTPTSAGIVSCPQKVGINGANTLAYPAPFCLIYRTEKFINPTVSFYTFGGVADKVTIDLRISNTSSTEDVDITKWTAQAISTKSASYLQNDSIGYRSIGSTNPAYSASIRFHYQLDSRLGVTV